MNDAEKLTAPEGWGFCPTCGSLVPDPVPDAPSSPASAREAVVEAICEVIAEPVTLAAIEAAADRILALVGSGVRLDREPALAFLRDFDVDQEDRESLLDLLDGCIVPVAGVRLTPDEAALAAEACRHDIQWNRPGNRRRMLRALAERLEREARP